MLRSRIITFFSAGQNGTLTRSGFNVDMQMYLRSTTGSAVNVKLRPNALGAIAHPGKSERHMAATFAVLVRVADSRTFVRDSHLHPAIAGLGRNGNAAPFRMFARIVQRL